MLTNNEIPSLYKKINFEDSAYTERYMGSYNKNRQFYEVNTCDINLKFC